MKFVMLSMGAAAGFTLGMLVLGCGGGPSEPNKIPQIDSVQASRKTVVKGDTATVSAAASDLDGDALSYAWSATAGSFPSGNSATSVVWRSPDALGTVTITVTVSDGEDTDSATVAVSVVKSAAELVSEAWSAFEAADYVTAEAKADSAITIDPTFVDGYNSRGWSRARRGKYSSAKQDFEEALSRQSNLHESRAGLALVDHVLNQFQAAVDAAQAVINSSPAFVFSHDPRVTLGSVRIVLAHSHYALGQYDQAAQQLDILDPGNAPYPTDPAELIRAIMRFLGQIS